MSVQQAQAMIQTTLDKLELIVNYPSKLEARKARARSSSNVRSPKREIFHVEFNET